MIVWERYCQDVFAGTVVDCHFLGSLHSVKSEHYIVHLLYNICHVKYIFTYIHTTSPTCLGSGVHQSDLLQPGCQIKVVFSGIHIHVVATITSSQP